MKKAPGAAAIREISKGVARAMDAMPKTERTAISHRLEELGVPKGLPSVVHLVTGFYGGVFLRAGISASAFTAFVQSCRIGGPELADDPAFLAVEEKLGTSEALEAFRVMAAMVFETKVELRAQNPKSRWGDATLHGKAVDILSALHAIHVDALIESGIPLPT